MKCASNLHAGWCSHGVSEPHEPMLRAGVLPLHLQAKWFSHGVSARTDTHSVNVVCDLQTEWSKPWSLQASSVIHKHDCPVMVSQGLQVPALKMCFAGNLETR